MRLSEKVELATKGAENPEQAGPELKQLMTKQDCGLAWSKHNTWLKSQPTAVQAEQRQKSKSEKGQAVCGLSIALRLQIAQSRYHLQTLDPKVGTICILGVLG